jgi:hypothetical protein
MPPLTRWGGGASSDAEQFELMERESELPLQPMPLPNSAFDSTKLNQAITMSQYCAELRERNATFYEDPKASEEASNMGLLDRNTLTIPWAGFTHWMTGDKQKWRQSICEDAEAESVDAPTSSGCVVA